MSPQVVDFSLLRGIERSGIGEAAQGLASGIQAGQDMRLRAEEAKRRAKLAKIAEDRAENEGKLYDARIQKYQTEIQEAMDEQARANKAIEGNQFLAQRMAEGQAIDPGDVQFATVENLVGGMSGPAGQKFMEDFAQVNAQLRFDKAKGDLGRTFQNDLAQGVFGQDEAFGQEAMAMLEAAESPADLQRVQRQIDTRRTEQAELVKAQGERELGVQKATQAAEAFGGVLGQSAPELGQAMRGLAVDVQHGRVQPEEIEDRIYDVIKQWVVRKEMAEKYAEDSPIQEALQQINLAERLRGVGAQVGNNQAAGGQAKAKRGQGKKGKGKKLSNREADELGAILKEKDAEWQAMAQLGRTPMGPGLRR